jgi:hypothetical protein
MGLIVLARAPIALGKLRPPHLIATSYTTARVVLSSGSLVRCLLVTLVCVLAGCPSSAESLAADDNGGGNGLGGGSSPQGCFRDADCATAAATCCECPAFAVNVNDPAHRACTGVSCPVQSTCPDNVEAKCDQGQCVLACVAMVCDATCAAGYVIDPTGCLSCACAAPEPGGCVVDGDCARTRADCCGCARGGEDTAVLASTQPGYDANLGCSASPACPAINVCEPGATPQCVQGLCQLAVGGLPAGACGRSDLPACPSGQLCTVNLSDPASQHGVGVCAPP